MDCVECNSYTRVLVSVSRDINQTEAEQHFKMESSKRFKTPDDEVIYWRSLAEKFKQE